MLTYNYLIMKKIAAIFFTCFFVGLYIMSCKKNSSNNNQNAGSSNLPQSVAASLASSDSLQPFARLFNTLSLSNQDVAGGVTVLALTGNSMVNPLDPDELKDYIIKGIVAPSGLTNGKVYTSITGKGITITVQNGNSFANGAMISTTPVATAASYSIYAVSGLYITGPPAYNDPNFSNYYIAYTENGVYRTLSGSYVTSWQFFNTNNFPTPVAGNCSYPTYNSYSSGPAQALVAFVADNPFWLQVNRANFTSPPQVGEYNLSASTYNAAKGINTGNCNLVINGAVFGCDLGDKDAYVHVSITGVHITQDLGLVKNGYYTGQFDAILYYTSGGGKPQKRIITGGSFMAPMGANQTTPLNGIAPRSTLDTMSILTTGKWLFKPLVEQADAIDPTAYPPCNLDDYIVFRTNGTCDWDDGADVCPASVSQIDHATNIPWALTYTNNEPALNFSSGGAVWRIVAITDSLLTLSDITGGSPPSGNFNLAHGN